MILNLESPTALVCLELRNFQDAGLSVLGESGWLVTQIPMHMVKICTFKNTVVGLACFQVFGPVQE